MNFYEFPKLSLASAPIILMTLSGCPLDLKRAQSSSKVSAILHAFYPGQTTGEAFENLMVLKVLHTFF